jgi:imidazolonepropionase-like amidohydrolase
MSLWLEAVTFSCQLSAQSIKEDITCRTKLVGYPAPHALKMSTGNAGIVLKWSKVLDPYPTYDIGTIRPDAYADILLWDGNPIENIDLILDEGRVWYWPLNFSRP